MTSPTQSLFRIEPTLAGKRRECAAFARSPATNAFLLYCICALVVTAALYASSQKLARKATVAGQVELAEGELKLYVDTRRILSKLFVKDGELVKQGQTLALLTRHEKNIHSTSSSTNSGQGFDALISSLKREALRLKQAKENAHLESSANQQSLSARSSTLKATRASHYAERRTLKALVALSQEQLERGRELYNTNHLSLAEFEELDQRHRQNELRLAANRRDTLALKDRLQSFEHQLATVDLQLQNTLGEMDEALERNQRELMQLQMSIEYRLVAPVDGVITGVLSHAGTTVEPNRPLITMVKNAAHFRARLWANSSAAGDLKTNQNVNLMLDAFPHQKHGMLSGTIVHINESPLTLQEQGAPWEGTGPTYALTVSIDNSSAMYSRLKPGMNLTADIKLDDSLLLERLFEPLIQAWQRTI